MWTNVEKNKELFIYQNYPMKKLYLPKEKFTFLMVENFEFILFQEQTEKTNNIVFNDWFMSYMCYWKLNKFKCFWISYYFVFFLLLRL